MNWDTVAMSMGAFSCSLNFDVPPSCLGMSQLVAFEVHPAAVEPARNKDL